MVHQLYARPWPAEHRNKTELQLSTHLQHNLQQKWKPTWPAALSRYLLAIFHKPVQKSIEAKALNVAQQCGVCHLDFEEN